MKWLRLFNKIQTEKYVEEFEKELDTIYLPILESPVFSQFVKVKKRNVYIENTQEAREVLLNNVGKEVIKHFSVFRFSWYVKSA